MKLNIKTIGALVGLGTAFGLVMSLSTPADTSGFNLLGGSLSTNQRDFRVFNNFSDNASNNNVTPHFNFPGTLGATMALSKGVHEWGSEWRGGNGAGDSTQQKLGTGQANFDSHWQGDASGGGNNNANIISPLAGSSGGVFAYMQGPISDGWTIKFYDGSWNWADGPDTIPGSQVDLQEVGCHEYGHALGLDHSGNNAATMAPFTSPGSVSGRSINFDDVDGVQAVYGVKSATKPIITAVTGNKNIGGSLVVTGVNFSSNNNEVWFSNSGNSGNATKVTGVSSSGGGTQITVTVPAGIIDGDVMVKRNTSGNASLSNAWPMDVNSGTADPPIATESSPSSGFAGGFTEVEIIGIGFTGVTSVKFGANEALSFSVDTGSQITVTSPPGTALATVDIIVEDADGTTTLPNGFLYSFDPPPAVDTLNPGNGPATGGTTVTITGDNVLGVVDVAFGGVSGTNIQIVSPNEMTVDTPAGSGTVDVVLTGTFGSDTLPSAFTYDGGPAGDFVNVGPGIGGNLGVPTLNGDGDLTPGSATGFTMTIGNCPPNAFGVWFWNFGNGGAVPFKQGTFYPIPVLFSIAFTLDASGSVSLPLAWDATIPGGISFTTQWWCDDPTAPAGAGGTNGLRMDLP